MWGCNAAARVDPVAATSLPFETTFAAYIFNLNSKVFEAKENLVPIALWLSCRLARDQRGAHTGGGNAPLWLTASLHPLWVSPQTLRPLWQAPQPMQLPGHVSNVA